MRKFRDDDDDDDDDIDDANATPRRRKTAKESLAETEPQSPPEY